MTPVHGTETSEGRLGAVLRAATSADPVRLGRFGPWLATTVQHARAVLMDPVAFDFPGDVSRQALESAGTSDTSVRSPHSITPPLRADQVDIGREVFATEWASATTEMDGSVVDAMQVLRRPVARSTVAAVLPHLDVAERNRVGDLVLDWIDALGPVIASRFGKGRFSRTRRREVTTRTVLEEALGGQDPASTATVLAAGIQVPIAAGSWLLAELASSPDVQIALQEDSDLVPGAVWETLRVCPPTWITARVARSNLALGEAVIEPGDLVLVSPLLLGRNEALAPGPTDGRPRLDEFAPGRWTAGGQRPGAWLPFGAGPHTCPGRNLGVAQLTHVAEWSRQWTMSLVRPVTVNQSRGIYPDPAVLRVDRRPSKRPESDETP